MTTPHEKGFLRPYQSEQANYQQYKYHQILSTLNSIEILPTDIWKVVSSYTGSEFAVKFEEESLRTDIFGPMSYMIIMHRKTWWRQFGQAMDDLSIGGEKVQCLRERNGAYLFVPHYSRLKRCGNMMIMRNVRGISLLGALRFSPYLSATDLTNTDINLHDKSTWNMESSQYAKVMYIFSYEIKKGTKPTTEQEVKQILMDVGINDVYYAATLIHGEPQVIQNKYVFAPDQITESQREKSIKNHHSSATKMIYAKVFVKDKPLSMVRFIRTKKWVKLKVRLIVRFETKPDSMIIIKHREQTRETDILNECDPLRENAPLCKATRNCGTPHLSAKGLCNGPKIRMEKVIALIEKIACTTPAINANMVITEFFMKDWLRKILSVTDSGLMDTNKVIMHWGANWNIHSSSGFLARAYLEEGIVTDLYQATNYPFKPNVDQKALFLENFTYLQHAHCPQQLALQKRLGLMGVELYMDGSKVKMRKKKRGQKRAYNQITLSINDGSIKSINSSSRSGDKEKKKTKKDKRTEITKNDSSSKDNSSPKRDKSPSNPPKKRKLS